MLMEVTKNFKFLKELPEGKDKAVLEGSTRSTKTYSIIQYLIVEWCLGKPKSVIRCFRFDSATHNDTTIKDFKEIMNMYGLWEAGSWNGTDKIFRFANGSEMSFSATSAPQKLQGKKQDVAWMNECMEISESAYAQIAFRTAQLTIFDFNPSYNKHWLFSRILPDETTAYMHSTYKDNPFLTPKQTREIECYEPTAYNKKMGTADAWKWDVYGLGKRGKVEGAVFQLYQETDFFPDPHMCQRYGLGLDFGFSLDPTAVIECAVFQDCLYLRELVYEIGLITTVNVSRPSEPSLEERLNSLDVDKNVKIYADCANPQQIADLNYSGFNVVPCVKGKDSILNGLNLMRERKIFIHQSSHNLITEFSHYKWKKDVRADRFKKEPIDEYNHLIDAGRYWCMAELQADKYARGATHQKKMAITSGRQPRATNRRFR